MLVTQWTLTACLWFSATGYAIGPDVIVGELSSVTDYNRSNEIAVLSMTTISCNAGDTPLQWRQLPNNQHPVIAQNLYRLLDGRMEQIGQAWVKHGFAALQNNTCFSDCRPTGSTQLGVHCADPYSENLNRGPQLGARSAINPFTGYYDGITANNHSGHIHTGISHGLQVFHSDLGVTGARYFVEAQYIAPDDALNGNGNNNASYREVRVTGNSGDWTLANVGPTVRMHSAIHGWPGATFVELDGRPDDGLVIVGYKVTHFGDTYRYDYAIYNMNSDRGIRSFSLPIGASETVPGFHDVHSHNEVFTNLDWAAHPTDGAMTWSTNAYNGTDRSNPIRWGTMYNFWVETSDPPVPGVATLGRYKPGAGPDALRVRVLGPATGDCNENGISDEVDLLDQTSADADGDGIPDECVFCLTSSTCGDGDRCRRGYCADGWCGLVSRIYGDVDLDGVATISDVRCVLQAFARPSECIGADLLPCEADGDVSMDDVLAALVAVDGTDPCCGQ